MTEGAAARQLGPPRTDLGPAPPNRHQEDGVVNVTSVISSAAAQVLVVYAL